MYTCVSYVQLNDRGVVFLQEAEHNVVVEQNVESQDTYVFFSLLFFPTFISHMTFALNEGTSHTTEQYTLYMYG